MKQLLLLAGAAALLAASSADAKPKHGKGHGKARHSQSYEGGYNAPGVGNCPPGLAKKSPACVPPGQAKKMFSAGQRFRLGYGGIDPYAYGQIPYDLRQQYGFDPYDNYYYGNGYIYQVDPTTMLVQRVIRALLR